MVNVFDTTCWYGFYQMLYKYSMFEGCPIPRLAVGGLLML